MREGTHAGPTAARPHGRKEGRPKILGSQKIALAKRLCEEEHHTVNEICKLVGVTKPRLYDYLLEGHKQN